MTAVGREWATALQVFAHSKREGTRALVAAIVAQAAIDLADGRQDAAVYFRSEWYRTHLDVLDLDVNLLPAGITRADLWPGVDGGIRR